MQRAFFDPVLLPGIQEDERTQFNHLQDESFFHYVDQLMGAGRGFLYRDYDFNIQPATDNKPYFSQYLRLSQLKSLSTQFGQGAVPFLGIGYLLVILTLVQITLAALVLILFPLLLLRWKGQQKAYTVLHFSGIGLGFMFVEIILIQNFILYFGNPVYAASVVLSGMLFCSGSGSYVSGRMNPCGRNTALIAGGIVVGILLFLLFLQPLLRGTIHWAFGYKLAFSVLLVAPISFLMGMPFPMGLRLLTRQNDSLVPWAWGINGCLSVISTALATVIAVSVGTGAVLASAALAYALVAVVNFFKKDL